MHSQRNGGTSERDAAVPTWWEAANAKRVASAAARGACSTQGSQGERVRVVTITAGGCDRCKLRAWPARSGRALRSDYTKEQGAARATSHRVGMRDVEALRERSN